MKLGMATAALYSRPKPSMITHRVPIHKIKQKPLTEPVRIETSGRRWLAVLTAVACERRVARELTEGGGASYCPLGRRNVFYQFGQRSKKAIIREFPVFSRYVFVSVNGRVNKDDLKAVSDRVICILGDSTGPIVIPSDVISRINDLELDGLWDATKFRPELSPFQPGRSVRIINGSLSLFPATVDALESEKRIRVLVSAFGRVSPVSVDLEDVEMVA